MHNNKEIISLVEKAKRGDIDAFETLINENKTMLYRIGIRILKSDEDVADAIQDTLLLTYKNMHKLKENQYFRTWIVRIMINECKRILKGKKRESFKENIKQVEQKHDIYPIEDELKHYIEQLDFKLQQVIHLKYYEDFKIKEIKQILNIPESTVKTRLTKAKKQLYLLMEGGL